MADPNGRPALQKPLPAQRRPGKPINRKRHRYCRSLCCCLSFLLFLVAICAVLSYLYFQPRLPLLRPQTIHVSKFNVSARADGTFLDEDASVKIFASNPNSKIAFSYGATDATMYIADEDGDIPVGSVTVPGFEQTERNATVIRFSVGVEGMLVDDSVGARLRTRFRSRNIRFRVEMRSSVTLSVGNKSIFRVPIWVQCRPMTVRQLAKSGVTLPRCEVYLFRWINLH